MRKYSENFSLLDNERGMTLIEILAVLGIIVFIMSFVGVNVTRKMQEGKQLAAKAQIKHLEQSLADFYRDNDFYPETEQGLDGLMAKPTIGREAKNWNGPYLDSKKIPEDPWKNEYQYICDDGQNYLLYSLGRDGKEGGEGFDGDIKSEE